ncbi:mitochondrial carnitine/acylcarnitine carrier protein-like [Tubulanus polymorphus]|uniref:mitochondrial carnitine/acylcarnitine carrier protein-like n=1 Tax=Tubulanus polymorphus TaxID=672921 RepID=UPI003DA47B51
MAGEDKVSPIKSFFAGGFGGVCVVFTGQPLDTIKVRLQTMPIPAAGENPVYSGTFDCAKKTIQLEGIRGLYKGMAAPIAGVAPIFAICFFGYNLGKQLQQNKPGDKLTYQQQFKAGLLAGCFTTAIMAPGERIKCLLQVQANEKNPKYKGPVDVVKQLYKQGGIRSVYKGTCATLLRDVPATGIYFASYEFFQDQLTPEGGTRKDLGPLQILLAGGGAGVCNWVGAIAPDTLKSRLQTAPEGMYKRGVRSVFVDIVKTEGPTALFKGLTPVMLRAFPANAACFLGYEMAMRALNYVFPNL